MNDTNETHKQSGRREAPQSIGDENIERLLSRAYQPEEIDEGFAARLTASLC